jgi:hypothetical protein
MFLFLTVLLRTAKPGAFCISSMPNYNLYGTTRNTITNAYMVVGLPGIKPGAMKKEGVA